MRGRPRTQGPRYASGRLKVPPHEVHPETLALRERQLQQDGIILTFTKIESGRETVKRTANDRLSGFTLGRLLLRHRQDKNDPGSISQDQFDAGEQWGGIVWEHSRLHGYRLAVAAQRYERSPIGVSNHEPPAHRIDRIKKQFRETYGAIMEVCDRHKHIFRQKTRDKRIDECWPARVVYGVVIEDWPAAILRPRDYGLLRECLNAIGKMLR